MKIKEIILEGFQSHKYTKLELSEAITLITGSSDSGKSALVRALRWVFFNRAPKGSFMLNEREITRVSVVYDSGDVLVRERGPKVNQYRLNDNIYKALKADVPPEISNFHKVSLDNCQWQYPFYFLLDETPGNVAKKFNEVADLSLMTEATTVAKALVSDANEVVETAKSEIKRLTEDLEKTDWVPRATVDLGEADKLMGARAALGEDLQALTAVISTVQAAEEALARFPDLSGLDTVIRTLESYEQGQKLLSARDQLFAAAQKVTQFQGILFGLPSVEPAEVQRAIDLSEGRDSLLNVRNICVEKLILIEELEAKLKSMPDVDVHVDVEGFETSRRSLTSDRSNLKRLIANVEKWQGELKAAEIRLVDAEEGYDKLKDEIGVCPECGQNLNHEGGCL